MKIALIVSMLVIIGAVVFFLVQRQAATAAIATSGADIDPVTGARWQTVSQARIQSAARGATQKTTAVVDV